MYWIFTAAESPARSVQVFKTLAHWPVARTVHDSYSRLDLYLMSDHSHHTRNYRQLSGSAQGKVNCDQERSLPQADGSSSGHNAGIWKSLAASPEHDTKRAMQSRHLMMLGTQPFQNLAIDRLSHCPVIVNSHRRDYRHGYISERWIGMCNSR